MSIANRRQREREERRYEILDAAEAVFADKGFTRATMDDIAAEAELSKGTLYLYFKNKDDLLMTLATRVIEDFVDDFERVARSPLSGIDTIKAMLHRQANHMLSQPQMFRIMIGRFAEGAAVDVTTPGFKFHRRLIRRIVGAFTEVIERGKHDGSVRPELDPGQTSAQLWCGLMGTLLMRLNAERIAVEAPHPIDPNRLIEGYVELICHGLQQPVTAESPS